MRFFEWSYFVQMIADWFLTGSEDAPAALRLEYILGLCVGGAIFLALTVLGGFGLMKMAKSQGKKYFALAFIPIVNTWYAGYVAGEATAFGKKFSHAAVYAAALEGVCVAIGVLSLVLDGLLIPYARAELISGNGTVQLYQFYISAETVPDSLLWAYQAEYGIEMLGVGWLVLLSEFLSLVFLFFEYTVLYALFKKFYPMSPGVITVVAVLLPVREIMFFAFRNNKPVDYTEFMRRRAEAFARRQGNPYSNTPGDPPRPSEDPFRDFPSSPDGSSDEPFDEFK